MRIRHEEEGGTFSAPPSRERERDELGGLQLLLLWMSLIHWFWFDSNNSAAFAFRAAQCLYTTIYIIIIIVVIIIIGNIVQSWMRGEFDASSRSESLVGWKDERAGY